MFPKMRRSTLKGIAAAAAGFLIHITLGNVYSFGNLMTYAVSYMHNRVSSTVTYNNFVWINSLTTGSQGLFMLLGGIMEKRLGPKLTCLIGCTIFSGGIILTYYTIDVSLFTVMLTYGVLAGTGTAIAYTTPMACGMQWFPRRKGLINGLIVGGFGLGAIVSTNIQTYYLNPDNVSPESDGYFYDDSVLDRVPTLFLVVGFTYILTEYIGCFFISRPSPDQEREELSQPADEAIEEAADDTTSSSLAPTDMKPKELLRQKTFYIFWFVFLFNGIAISYISAMYKSFGQTFISDDHFLAQIGSFAAIFNASGRIMWGRIMDKTSFRLSLRLLCIILAVLLGTMPLTEYMGKVGYAIWVWLIYLTFSGTFSLMPTGTEKAFGSKHYSSNYGLVFSCQVISGSLMAAVNELMLNAFGYTGCFLTMGGIVVLSVGLTFFIPNGL